MKNKLLFRISFSALILLFSGLFTESKAQKSNPDIFFPNRKKTSPVTRRNTDPVVVKDDRKSNPNIFFPNRKRTSPVTRKRTYPVYSGNRHNLPPGQAKKIYGDRSARDYSPGHQKKNKNFINRNKENEQGDNDDHGNNGNKKHHGKGHDD